jgi:hypothetical protein
MPLHPHDRRIGRRLTVVFLVMLVFWVAVGWVVVARFR